MENEGGLGDFNRFPSRRERSRWLFNLCGLAILFWALLAAGQITLAPRRRLADLGAETEQGSIIKHSMECMEG